MGKRAFVTLIIAILVVFCASADTTAYETFFHVVWHATTTTTNYSWLYILDTTASTSLGTSPAINLSFALGSHDLCVIEFMTTLKGTHTLGLTQQSGFTDGDEANISYDLNVRDEYNNRTITLDGGTDPVQVSWTAVATKSGTLNTFHYPLSTYISSDIISEMQVGTTYYSDLVVEVTGP